MAKKTRQFQASSVASKDRPRTERPSVSDQKRLDEILPKLGPFPWLRTLEVLVENSPKLDEDAKKKTAELFRFIRVELRERSAVTEAEQALLRFLRSMSVEDQ